MSKTEPEHYDKLGNRIELSDVVAVAHHNNLIIARVIKICPKMIKVKEFKNTFTKWDTSECNKYPSDMVRISGQDAVIYILKHT